MAFSNPGGRRKPSTQKRGVTQYVRADGTLGPCVQYTESCSISSDNDVDELRISERHECACGCYVETAPAGVCEVCATQLPNPNVCQKHHVVCHGCGASLCMRHSVDGGAKGVRVCAACHLKNENAATIASCTSFLKRIITSIFGK